MAVPRFDLPGLLLAVDAERRRQGLSWAALSRHVGAAASTIRRFGEADDAEADGVLATVGWLGVAPEQFIKGGVAEAERLPDAGDGFVRVDMELVASASADLRCARGRTRTSIQALVEVAQRSRRTVASLTQLSDA